MAEQNFKRHVAFKLRIGDINSGSPILEEERFKNLDLDNKKIVRVNVVANIIEKYESEGEKTYTFITIDDASGQIKLKAFGDDAAKLKNATQGQTILVIGVLRYFNNELYISPEIVREQDPKYLLVRKLEVEKARAQSTTPATKEQIISSKDKIIETIKNSVEGVEVEELKTSLRDISPEIIDQEIKKALEDGTIFEPRPGRIRYLG